MDMANLDMSLVSPVAAARMDRIFASVLGEALDARGFEHVAARKWVRSSKPEIREIFAVKYGGVLVWGFSLDFVPHVSGDTVVWHRTAKSSVLDLRYDPTDYLSTDADVRDWQVQSLFGEAHAESAARHVLIKCLPLAMPFFDMVSGMADLPRAFELQMARPAARLGFHNYIQQPLAYLFTLARLGEQERAQALLDEYVSTYELREWVGNQLRARLKKSGR